MSEREDWWRPGIAGGQVPALSTESPRFEAWAHALARDLGGDLSASASVGHRTFDAVKVAHRSGSVWLLGHLVVPVVAAAPTNPDFTWSFEGRFVVVPSGADPRGYGLIGLTAADLDRPLTEDLLAFLTPEEQRDVRHWTPDSVGQAAFNYWD